MFDDNQPKPTAGYDGQNPFSEGVHAVEIRWDGIFFVERVFFSREEFYKENPQGRVLLPIDTANEMYEFRHLHEESDKAVEIWP